MPKITSLDDGTFELVTPYDKDFLDAIKELVPASDRKWIRDPKSWIIEDDHKLEVLALVQNHFGDCDVEEE